ncbi:g7802 [Coccomyxa viridis]|uniref:G7802 protein n=1 Tax=Coccomyxa viridis TaxID=1274662 RepID=A0ABP1FYR5_9CHLO
MSGIFGKAVNRQDSPLQDHQFLHPTLLEASSLYKSFQNKGPRWATRQAQGLISTDIWSTSRSSAIVTAVATRPTSTSPGAGAARVAEARVTSRGFHDPELS